MHEAKSAAWFGKAWEANPRKVGGKSKTLKLWHSAIKRDGLEPQWLYERWMQFLGVSWPPARIKQEGKGYMPHMATWLNQGRYEDEDEAWKAPWEAATVPEEAVKAIFENSNAERDDALIRKQALRIAEMRAQALARQQRSAAKRAARLDSP